MPICCMKFSSTYVGGCVSHQEGQMVTFIFLIASIEMIAELPATAWRLAYISSSKDKKQLSPSLELQG